MLESKLKMLSHQGIFGLTFVLFFGVVMSRDTAPCLCFLFFFFFAFLDVSNFKFRYSAVDDGQLQKKNTFICPVTRPYYLQPPIAFPQLPSR